MTTFVIVHGGWHTGDHFEPTAAVIRQSGHTVHLPTVRGNAPGDSKNTGLDEAISSIVAYLEAEAIEDCVLVGHSYGGMVITGVTDRVPTRVRRVVYWAAFVPDDGESLNDLVPPHYVALFDGIVAADGSVRLPEAIWREAFMNDASLEQATEAYATLNPHPYNTFTEKISLSVNPAESTVPKSYINGTDDIALPQSYGWHPRFSKKLGLFRLVQIPGGHELCFTDPGRLAQAIMDAGRD
jgi:pimeloyl-ACP methyl ester carboxylesterase